MAGLFDTAADRLPPELQELRLRLWGGWDSTRLTKAAWLNQIRVQIDVVSCSELSAKWKEKGPLCWEAAKQPEATVFEALLAAQVFVLDESSKYFIDKDA